jgi:multidrug efflux pump subunit AcrA (membrane-fusion protein)
LQSEIARNQLWQQQLQRDQIVDPYIPEGVPESLIPEASDETQRRLEVALAQTDYEVLMADANLNSTLNRGPDLGSLASANAAVINAQIGLDRLLNGPSESDLQRAQIGLRQAELALELARENLARTALVAPFAGVIASMELTVGELPPATGAFQLVDDNSYFVNLLIDETEIADIEAGQPVSLLLDALPEAMLSAQVTQVAQTPTRLGEVVTYRAQVVLDPTLEPVRIGMNTTATIKIRQLQDVPILRNRFIRIDRSTQQAYVTIQREDGRFEEVEVQLGLRNETHSQILSGLQPGQRVVLLARAELNIFGN